MQRLYTEIIKDHLANHTQMLFLMGPRQVGKTTTARTLLENRQGFYLNWDNPEDRLLFLSPFEKIIEKLGPKKLGQGKPILICDEIHKYKNWKNHIKGLYDLYKSEIHIIVTGSARLDIYHKGGDSLMGRYFPYTVFPFTIRELQDPTPLIEALYHSPQEIERSIYENLFIYGGFPDPFIQKSSSFSQKWQQTRFRQLFREDLRDLNSIQDIDQLELLAFLLQEQAGGLCTYTALAKKIRVSDQTIRRWITLLEASYFCFTLRPYTKNITRSLLKEPKIYTWDWSIIKNEGAKFENFVACHLMKYVYFLSQTGKGKFDLFYVRDKDKNEVDFLLTYNDEPWILIETKYSEDRKFSASLKKFYQQLKPEHCFQVVYTLPYVPFSCFEPKEPLIVPCITLLSQLV